MLNKTTYENVGSRLAVAAMVILLVVSAAGVAAGTAQDDGPPGVPHKFFGSVADGNGDAVAGATVEIVYDGSVIASTQTDANGDYGVKVDDPDDSATDEQVTVRVANSDASATETWASGESTSNDFTVGDVLTPTPEPTTEEPSEPTPDEPTESTPDETTEATTTEDDGDNAGGGGGGQQGPSGPSYGGSDDPTTEESSPEESPEDTPDETPEPTPEQTTTELTPTTTEPTPQTDVDTQTTNDDGQPGFGAVAALVAMLAAALLAVRRHD